MTGGVVQEQHPPIKLDIFPTQNQQPTVLILTGVVVYTMKTSGDRFFLSVGYHCETKTTVEIEKSKFKIRAT